MLDRRTTAWCHVNAPAEHAPQALRELSARAGLDKDSISLSFLLLRKLREEEQDETASRDLQRRSQGRRRVSARIISDAFIVPDYPGRARYACTELGLALIPASSHLAPGALCDVWTTPERDRKSRAIIMLLEDGAPRREGAPRPGQRSFTHEHRGPRPTGEHRPRRADRQNSERRSSRRTSDEGRSPREERPFSPRGEHQERHERRDSRPTGGRLRHKS